MRDLFDTAKEAGSFEKLTAAIEAAGLGDTLKQKGPFTVFAPTDEAFAKLPAGSLERLLEDKAKLTAVLTHHVVSGRVTSAEVAKMDHATALDGQDVAISTDGGVHVGKANVVKADVEATNGIIHVIDEVILPQ